jgi:aspartyl-tRNA(Asn)/glutamyl-tRNA(Gln) amidotransferase subunit B
MNRIRKVNCASVFFRRFSTKPAPKLSEWKSVIGLEIHAQIASESKLFSGSKNSFSAEINSSVSLLDAAIPGCLPVLNKRCVEAAVKTALALNCKINEVSMFDRKHYFYSDLPAGYQITQQRAPIAGKGALSFPVLTPVKQSKAYYKSVRLHQLQLEQDSGKSLHDDELKISLIDLNRAGMPLMELVFEPDLSDGEEAAALVKELILIFSRIQTCHCRMEEGQLRVDANVSIHKEGDPLGTRTEIKNIGSVRGVAQAIEYEIQRQKTVRDQGGVIINETRQWDATSKTTIAMRDKEVVQDYRYMPEPNLLPLHLNMSEIESNEMVNVKSIEKSLPVLPQGLRDELVNDHKLSQITAMILVVRDKFIRI